MAQQKPFNFSLKFVEPVERLLTIARSFAASPDENRRCVAKALLDVTSQAVALGKAMQENKPDAKVDMAPYLDFWFADAVACAEKLSQYEDSDSRDLAMCLIDAEKAVIQSKESVLAEIKRLGLKPGKG